MKKGNGLVCVGVPRERMLIPTFVDSRDLVIEHLRKIKRFGGELTLGGCYIHKNRNAITEAFLKKPNKPEWLLFLDNDMTFPSRIGERLAKWNVPVVGGLYFEGTGIYDPLCYKMSAMKENKYGDRAKYWQPLRSQVYDFLVSCNVPPVNKAMEIDHPVKDPMLSCDGVATGAMMIHRSVLEALKPPWFDVQAGGAGEDLNFCWRVRTELNLPVYCDMSTVCGHLRFVPIGHSQFLKAYEHRGIQITGYDRSLATELLAGYLEISEEEARHSMKKYRPRNLAELWSKSGLSTADEVDGFYRREDVGRMYLLDLLGWNAAPFYNHLRRMLVPMQGLRVLELGGGIGSLAIQLAYQDCEVTMVEPNDVLRGFTDYRWNYIVDRAPIVDRHGPLQLLSEIPDEGEFDLVLAVDVFEHIHPDVMPELIEKIAKLVPERGRIFHHNTWSTENDHPMHFNHSELWTGWLKDVGFYEFNPPLWSMKIR